MENQRVNFISSSENIFSYNIMKQIFNFISDNAVRVSAVNAGIWLSALEWSIKIAFGLPSAIYVCLKLYHEFLKRKQSSENMEEEE